MCSHHLCDKPPLFVLQHLIRVSQACVTYVKIIPSHMSLLGFVYTKCHWKLVCDTGHTCCVSLSGDELWQIIITSTFMLSCWPCPGREACFILHLQKEQDFSQSAWKLPGATLLIGMPQATSPQQGCIQWPLWCLTALFSSTSNYDFRGFLLRNSQRENRVLEVYFTLDFCPSGYQTSE